MLIIIYEWEERFFYSYIHYQQIKLICKQKGHELLELRLLFGLQYL